MKLDPFFPGLNLHYGRTLFFMRESDRAIAIFAGMLETFPGNAAANEYFGDVCAAKGMTHEAITQWAAALASTGKAEDARQLEEVFAQDGFEAALRALATRSLEDLERKHTRGEYVAAAHYVLAYVRQGNFEEAFTWLPKTAQEPNWFAYQLRVHPLLDPLRSDPRFEAIVQKLAPKFN